MDSCEYPDCPSGRMEKVQDDRHDDITKRLDNITGNQEKIITTLGQIGGLLSDVKHLQERFDEFRKDAKKEHDEIFERLRAVESGKADKADLEKMQSRGLDWLWDLVKLAAAAVLGVIVGKKI